jgi:ABC-type transport system substrate-binding protein
MKIKDQLYYLLKNTAWALLASAVFLSCQRNENLSNVFTYNESNGIASLDPAFARDLEIMWATNQLFDGLVEMDSTLNIVPSVARRWELSSDKKTYTFTLREDVYFHASPLFNSPNTRKVVANDFVYSFRRILDPALASPGQWIFNMVDTLREGGFEAPNDSTLVVHLRQPFPPFLGMLTTQYCNVVPREVVEHYGADFRAHPIGCGPFQFAHWYENVALVFHRFPNYWQQDDQGVALPYLDAVKIDLVKDMSVEFQGLLQGRYDFMSGIHPAFKDELLTGRGELREAYNQQLRMQRTPFIKTDYLGFYIDPTASASPLQSPMVRKALNLAIDKKYMVRYLRNNTVFPAGLRFVPPALLPAAAHDTSEVNVEQAKRWLMEANYPSDFTIVMSTTSDYADLLEFVQHQWAAIGVKSEVQVLQSSAFRDASAKGQLMCFRKSWLADYADAENFFALFTSANFCPAGPNYTHFSSAAFDDLYAAANNADSDSIRNDIFLKMDALLREELPCIPLYYDQVTHFVRTSVSGLQTNPVNMLDLKTVKKKP